MRVSFLLFCFLCSAMFVQAQDFNQAIKAVAADRGHNDYFGWSVAISGNYAIVGARLEDENATGGNTLTDAGSAYIFERDGSGIWTQVQKIVAADRAASDHFGTSVAISGNYAIVGANLQMKMPRAGNPITSAGAAYIFERDGSGTWVQMQKIVAADRAVTDLFGLFGCYLGQLRHCRSSVRR